MFEHQITELRQYINWGDEQIACYRKTGRNTERLSGNKDRAIRTIAELEGYQAMKGKQIGA